ncbi:aspartate aminotransferase family protein [Motiliproteus sp. MSK22-1]|uniref:aspartate aminotransferase family protein n=1 Tax=Motiliproteus sp. MSK22-1 TaxID=1897630 RepID=UPI0009763876|nr:aspartate aminotransferase family protein [Motiliproteus sp. MSK22-1]OMH33833.1 glutamate-1-semialdehyde 2,1-aminomutase [Motiliproteus sp. MSK22-1]
MMNQQLSRGARIFQRAQNVLPGGVSRNTVLRRPHPLYAERGEGCYVTDIDGVRRIDFANNMASLIHGHAHPAVVGAVTEQLQKGSAFTLATEEEVCYAEHMCSRSPGFDKIRFVNSGTEAVMSCLKAARAYTGRPKIAKVEGAYHGLYDYAEVSQTAKPTNWGDPDQPASVPVAHGTPASALNDVVVIPFNDPQRAIAILDQHADELACVLIDLLPHRVGLIPASAEFVRALRKWTRENGALLVCDEVITFRSTYGGAQDWYELRPDLTAMGKMIGGGFPVGALAGRKEVMDVMDPWADKVLFPHSGTFSANPITMVAGHVSMELFTEPAVIRLNGLADRARDQITEAIRIADVPACVTGGGSMFRVHMKAEAPEDYRSGFVGPDEARLTAAMLDHLFDNGIMMINTCSGTLSTAMTEQEIDTLADVMLSGFRKIRA